MCYIRIPSGCGICDSNSCEIWERVAFCLCQPVERRQQHLGSWARCLLLALFLQAAVSGWDCLPDTERCVAPLQTRLAQDLFPEPSAHTPLLAQGNFIVFENLTSGHWGPGLSVNHPASPGSFLCVSHVC